MLTGKKRPFCLGLNVLSNSNEYAWKLNWFYMFYWIYMRHVMELQISRYLAFYQLCNKTATVPDLHA